MSRTKGSLTIRVAIERAGPKTTTKRREVANRSPKFNTNVRPHGGSFVATRIIPAVPKFFFGGIGLTVI